MFLLGLSRGFPLVSLRRKQATQGEAGKTLSFGVV